VARDALVASALDHGSDPEAFRKDLINIARTTRSSKILTTSKQFFSDLAVNAVMRLKGKNNLEGIQIIKILGGALTDSYLDEVRAIVPLARMPFVHTSKPLAGHHPRVTCHFCAPERCSFRTRTHSHP
jgi:chaperonin GroEL (HSP60 family)